jgi:hypothetical protein
MTQRALDTFNLCFREVTLLTALRIVFALKMFVVQRGYSVLPLFDYRRCAANVFAGKGKKVLVVVHFNFAASSATTRKLRFGDDMNSLPTGASFRVRVELFDNLCYSRF